MKDASRPSRLLDRWVEALPSKGRYSFTAREASEALGVARPAFNRVMGRLSAENRVARIHRDFYVVVPLEHAAVGIIPPDWFIVDLMRYLGQPFYVALLSAAGYHGASHQRPQSYQIITDKPVRTRACRGVSIRFFVKKECSGTPLEQIKGVTGFLPVSTPEATALDLVRYCRQIGGLGHVLTVLQELGERLSADRLAAAATSDNNLTYAQRLGWLLEQTEFADRAVALQAWLAKRNPLPARLEPSLPLKKSIRDMRWNLWVNTTVEGDLS